MAQSTGGGGFTPLENLTARFNFPQAGGYFKTDIIMSPTYTYKMKVCQIQSRGTAYFGSRQVSNDSTNCMSIERSSSDQRFMGKIAGTQYKSAEVMQTNTRYIVTLTPSGLSSNPTTGGNTTSTYSYTSNTIPMAVGGLYLANNSINHNKGGFDIFGLEIYDENNVLIHRLIPQSTMILLDEVTGIGYNSTGSGIRYADD